MNISLESWNGTSFELELFLLTLLRISKGKPIYLEVDNKKFIILEDTPLSSIISGIME